MFQHFIHRHEPRSGKLPSQLKSGLGGVFGVAFVAALAAMFHEPFLIAPFGATAVLVFGHPASPLAQPANVVGGYMLSALVAVALLLVLPAGWLAAALGVGAAIALMLMFRLSHPPAGAIPILAATTAIGHGTLLLVVIVGSAGLVAVAVLHHMLPPRREYPKSPVI